MASKNKDAFSEAIVGVFMLAVLSLLVYFTIIISGVDVLQGRKKVDATVVFKDVGGLKDHDNVMYRGTKVGTIDKIDLGPDELKVTMEIDKNVVLRETCRISVCSLSMLGGNYLLLEEGEGAALPLETTVFKGETPTDWMRDLSSIAKNINELTSGEELKSIVEDFGATAKNLRSTTGRIERGEGTVGRLLSNDDTVYNDLKTVMTNLAAVTTNIKEGRGTVGKLLSDDDTVYNDLKSTLASASEVAARLKDGEGFLGRLLAKDDPIYGEIDAAVKSFRKASESFDAKEAMEGAEKLLDSLNSVASKIERGEGTIGKLVNEDELYNEINSLAKDVRQVLDNFRDTTPVSTFGSLITGGL